MLNAWLHVRVINFRIIIIIPVYVDNIKENMGFSQWGLIALILTGVDSSEIFYGVQFVYL